MLSDIKKILEYPLMRQDKELTAYDKSHPCARYIWFVYHNYPLNALFWKASLTQITRSSMLDLFTEFLKHTQDYNDKSAVLPGILNQSEFKKVINYGLYSAKIRDYIHLQWIMKMKEAKVGYYIAYNRDNCDLHEEAINYDDNFMSIQESRVESIIENSEMPKRIKNMPSYYLCKECIFNKSCYEQQVRIT
jgi:hypothetical protein